MPRLWDEAPRATMETVIVISHGDTAQQIRLQPNWTNDSHGYLAILTRKDLATLPATSLAHP